MEHDGKCHMGTVPHTKKGQPRKRTWGKNAYCTSERTNVYSPELKIVQGREKILKVVCF